jgi:hypothetical protein
MVLAGGLPPGIMAHSLHRHGFRHHVLFYGMTSLGGYD